MKSFGPKVVSGENLYGPRIPNFWLQVFRSCTICDRNGNSWRPVFKRKNYFSDTTYRIGDFLDSWVVTRSGKEESVGPENTIDMRGVMMETADGGWWPEEGIEYMVNPRAEITLRVSCEKGWVGVWQHRG